VSNSNSAGSTRSTMQMGLDTPSHRQHGKLSLLPQDAHPTLRSHPLQCFLLLQVKTLCFSWILAHQGLLPVHEQKAIQTTLNHKSYSVLNSVSHFISLEEQVVSLHCNKGVAYSMPVATKHSGSSPSYHPPTRLSSPALSQKAGRSDTLWKTCSGSAHSFT